VSEFLTAARRWTEDIAGEASTLAQLLGGDDLGMPVERQALLLLKIQRLAEELGEVVGELSRAEPAAGQRP
jgi:hypothetical protein